MFQRGHLDPNLFCSKTTQRPPATLLSEQIWYGGGTYWHNLISIPWRVWLHDLSMKKKIKNQSVAEVVWNIRAKRENCIDSRPHHFHQEGEEGLVLVDCREHWIPSMCQCQENVHAVDHWQWGIVAHTRDHCKGRSSANSRWFVEVNGPQSPREAVLGRANVCGIFYVIIVCELCSLFLFAHLPISPT